MNCILNLSTCRTLISLITIVFVADLPTIQAQTIYYVSAAGDDAANGTTAGTAWKTLDKVNAFSFSTGDQILFRRGDTFYGKLTISISGIALDAFGSGPKPIISGAQLITTEWIRGSDDIWETSFVSPPAEITNVTRADTLLPISRYPNKNVNNGYLNFETTSGKTQFSDQELSADWSNSEIVVRAERYRLVRTKVAGQSGDTINIVSNPDIINNLSPGKGYFFTNDIRAIDLEGEWAYQPDSGKLYVKSATHPGYMLYSKQDTVVSVMNANDVKIANLRILMGNKLNLSVDATQSFLMENCDILNSGGDAAFFNNVQGIELLNNFVSQTNWNGITTSANCTDALIQRNEITNIGNEAFGKAKVFYGIYNVAPGSQILYNTVSHCVGIGILACGQNTFVKRNIVDQANTGLEDYGSIYTNYNVGNNTGLVIEENIVQHSFGERAGWPADHSLAQGIYLDNNTTGVTVKDNTVWDVSGSAYFVGTYRANNILERNTSFSSGEHELWVLNPNNFPVVVNENIFVSNTMDTNRRTVYIRSARAQHTEIGEFTDNFVVNPFNTRNIDVEFLDNGAPKLHTYTPYLWNTETPNVTGTSPAPIVYPDSVSPSSVISFYVNPTDSLTTVMLPSGRYVDARGYSYEDSIALAPFASAVLFRYTGSVSDSCSVPSGLTNVEVKDFTSKVSWQTDIEPINFDLRYRPVDNTAWIYANNIQDTTSFQLVNLLIETNYEWQVRSSCFGAESSWSALLGFKTLTLPPENLDVKELLGSSATLTWDPYDEAVFYQVRYRRDADTIWNWSDSIPNREQFISGLVPLANYVSNVRSRSIKGWSEWSDTLSFSTTQGGQIKRIIAGVPNQWLVRNVSTNLVEFRPHATALFIGRVSNIQSGIAVFPFQLPILAAGQEITGADFIERIDSPILPIMPQIWGMPYRINSDYSLADYYDGQFSGANQVNATLIQDPWVDVNKIASNTAHDIDLLYSGRANLKLYFQQQYLNGAYGGEWAFLRINPTTPSTSLRLLLDRTEDNDAYFPQVSLILTPLSSDLPEAAGQLTGSAISTGSISLSWEDFSDNETGFVIERKPIDGYYTPVDTLSPNAITFTDQDLNADRIYVYRILAFNENGVIGYSNETTVKTRLSAPSNVNGIIDYSNTVEITWENSNFTATGFLIERKTIAGNFNTIGVVGTDSLIFRDSSALLNELPYIYRLRAFSSTDTSAYSLPDTVTIDDFETITLYEAKSSVNGSVANPPFYTNSLADHTQLLSAPAFHPDNLPGGCPYAVQANFIQSDTTYHAGLSSYAEFILKPESGDYKLRIDRVEIKARKPVGDNYNVKFRIAYSLDSIDFTDNGADLSPTPAACSAAGYGVDFVKLTTQSWDINGITVIHTGDGIRFRVYYFNQPIGGNMGLPLIVVKGAVVPVF